MSRRGNGSGTLVKKPNGTYLAKWMYKGKVYTRTTGEADKRKALKKLEEFVKPFTENNEIDTLMMLEAKVKASRLKLSQSKAKDNDIPIEKIADAYFSDVAALELNEKTKNTETCYINSAVKWFKDKYPSLHTIQEINDRLADEYVNYAFVRYSPKTYNSVIYLLKKVWKRLSHNGEWFDNIWVDKKIRKGYNTSNRRQLTTAEIVKLMEKAKDDEERLLLCLGIYTGMRLGDCCNLKWSQIDFDMNTLAYIPQKTRKFHPFTIKLPIHRVLLKGLKLALTWRSNHVQWGEYVLPTMARRYSTRVIFRNLDRLFKDAGIDVSEVDDSKPYKKYKMITGFHSLRRTFVSIAINSGMNPFLVQKIVGHSNATMTEYYYETERETMIKGFEKLPDFTTSTQAVQTTTKHSEEVYWNTEEGKELEALIDSWFDENGNPIRDKTK